MLVEQNTICGPEGFTDKNKYESTSFLGQTTFLKKQLFRMAQSMQNTCQIQCFTSMNCTLYNRFI